MEAAPHAVLRSLRGLRLMDFDWDGAKGLPMRADVADLAHDLFGVPDWVVLGIYEMPMPTVTLNSNGTVEIAFDGGDGRQLLLTVECDGVITYIKVFPDDQTTVEGVIRLVSNKASFDYVTEAEGFEEFVELLTWVSDDYDQG